MDRLNKITFALDKISLWSLYLLIFCLPFSKSIVEITIVTALVSFVALKLVRREPMLGNITLIDLALIIFIAANILSLLNTQYPALSIRALFSKILKFALLFVLAREIINTRTKLKDFITMAILSCVIIIIDGFIQYFFTRYDILHMYPAFKYAPSTPWCKIFPTASFPFPNDYAAWILIFIFPAAIFAFLGKGNIPARLGAAMLFFGLLYSLILTKARGAWSGFLLALGTVPFFRLKKGLILLAAAILIIIVFLNENTVQDIFSRLSFEDRKVMWENGVKIFKEHPIIGNGVNTFFNKYRFVRQDEDKGRGSYAHNCYLQMAADIGLVGLLSFIFFTACVLFKAFASLKKTKDPLYYSLMLGTSLGLTAFLLHSFVDTNLYSLNLAALFWLSAGILTAVVKMAGSDS
ncbi:MAG: O-antigen ligase family protein [Candidatus Omnitrophota bacterium]|jgi:putative inorganic carbon (HCO3(-)) transporter